MTGYFKFGLLTLMLLAVAAGCAPTNVQQESMDTSQLERPSLILVYDFADRSRSDRYWIYGFAGNGPAGHR